jgi:hypothetical protein
LPLKSRAVAVPPRIVTRMRSAQYPLPYTDRQMGWNISRAGVKAPQFEVSVRMLSGFRGR